MHTAVSYFIVLYSVTHHTISFCMTLHCTVLDQIAVYNILHCIILYCIKSFLPVLSRSGRSLWLPGGSDGLGPLTVGSPVGLRIPSDLLLLSTHMGHLPHRAPLQYSREASEQGAVCVRLLISQRPPPAELAQQRLRSSEQGARVSCPHSIGWRPQASIFLCSGRSQLSDIQRQAAKQRGVYLLEKKTKNFDF